MIAATEPQEFVPNGRQQALRHPGPPETPQIYCAEIGGDDLLLHQFEKVSLNESQMMEWWRIRKVDNYPHSDDTADLFKSANREGAVINKSFTTFLSNKSQSDMLFEDSWKPNGNATVKQLNSSRRISEGTSKLSSKFKRLSGESQQVPCSPKEYPTNYCSYLRLKTSCDYIEEELYVKGNLVVWSQGLSYNNEQDEASTVNCSYLSEYPVIDAIWCDFQSDDLQLFATSGDPLVGERLSCVCIADAQTLKTFTMDQDDFITSMPFAIKKLWQCKFGMLVERSMNNDEAADLEIAAKIFVINHPLDMGTPLVYYKSGSYKLFEGKQIEIVFSSPELNIYMIYDSFSKRHSIYTMRKLLADEIEAYRLSNRTQSIINTKSKSFASFMEFKQGFPGTSFDSRPSSSTQLASRNQNSIVTSTANSRCNTPILSPLLTNNASPLRRMNSQIMSSSRFPTRDETENFTCNPYNWDPHYCFDSVWSESLPDEVVNCASNNVFLSDDLTGQRFLCYLVNSRSQLCLLKIDYLNNNKMNKLIFGLTTTLSAKDAINLPHLHMLAILEHGGNVVLYSGLTTVGKLHIGGALTSYLPSPFTTRKKELQSPFPRRSSLLPNCGPLNAGPRFDEHLLSPVLPSAPKNPIIHVPEVITDSNKVMLTALKDSIENKLTLQYSDGSYYRVSLPFIVQSTLVESCLNALRISLPKDCCMTLLCKWYSVRNAPGTQEMLVEEEWKLFENLMFELLGFEGFSGASIGNDQNNTPCYQVKRQKATTHGNDNHWVALVKNNRDTMNCLNSAIKLKRIESSSLKKCKDDVKANPNILHSHVAVIHYVLHLLYEDIKLNILRKDELPLLATFLSKLAQILNLDRYVMHYWKDFPLDCPFYNPNSKQLVNENEIIKWTAIPLKPTSIFEHLLLLCSNSSQEVKGYPIVNHINVRSRDVVQLCGTYLSKNADFALNKMVNVIVPPSSRNKCPEVQNSILKVKSNVTTSDTAAQKLVLLLVDMKIDTRELETYPFCVNYMIYDALWACRDNPPSDWSAEAYYLLRRCDLGLQAANFCKNKSQETASLDLFSSVNELLPSINQNRDGVVVDGMEEVDDSNILKLRFANDQRVSEVRRLLQSSRPVPVALVQRPDTSDHDFLEEQERHLFAICARTMALPVGRGMFTLRTSSPVITETLQVPPLCLSGKAPPRGATVELTHIDTPINMNQWPLFHNGVANGLRVDSSARNIDSTWIVFNKPKTNADTLMEHAGFLMALGLNGHLQNLATLSTYDYLLKLHEMTSVGILLGMAAAFRGTANATVTKMFCVHIEALLPPTSIELDVPQNLQVAALLGIGLLYQGTARRYITEVLLTEIGRPPGPEMENSVDRQSYSLAAGLGLGIVMLRQGGKSSGLADLNVPDTLHYYMVGGSKRPFQGSQKDKYKVASFQIREGSCVNLDVTAPGATLALGLMYLGTGNKAIADWMAPPTTQYLLDFVRPDFLMLRTLSRALILWNSIEPEKDWVENQVPNTIRPYCMVEPNPHIDLDYEAMNQAYCNIIAGACFALGLKFAGSADESAFEVLLEYCHMFTSLTTKSIAELAGKPTIETCLNVVLLSAAMVMAGTGNLEIMRIVRYLRRRVGLASSAVVTYGSHLALHMALGLLFLGGGRYTLSNSPASVATLICAFYPKFPTHSNDNRYHLQAFRHLYVLAVEPRLIIPKDITNGQMCYANITIVKLDGITINIKAPTLIPDPNTLYKVSIRDDRYWPIVFERERNWEQLLKTLSVCCIDVKQRAGCLSYLEDKQGFKSEIAKTLTRSKEVPWNPLASAISNFSSDTIVKHFVDHFLTPRENLEIQSDSQTRQQNNLTRVTYDCVIRDKLCLLPLLNQLLQVVNTMQTSNNTMDLCQFQVVTAFAANSSTKSHLTTMEWLLSLHQEAVTIVDNWEPKLKTLLGAYIRGCHYELLKCGDGALIVALAKCISFYNIPYAMQLLSKDIELLDVVCQLQAMHCNSETVDKVLRFLNFVR